MKKKQNMAMTLKINANYAKGLLKDKLRKMQENNE